MLLSLHNPSPQVTFPTLASSKDGRHSNYLQLVLYFLLVVNTNQRRNPLFSQVDTSIHLTGSIYVPPTNRIYIMYFELLGATQISLWRDCSNTDF